MTRTYIHDVFDTDRQSCPGIRMLSMRMPGLQEGLVCRRPTQPQGLPQARREAPDEV